jgi:hypothetical protein
MAEGGGHVITLILNYLCKCFRTKHLEARGVELLFRWRTSAAVRRCPFRGDSRGGGKAWIVPDGAGCYHILAYGQREALEAASGYFEVHFRTEKYVVAYFSLRSEGTPLSAGVNQIGVQKTVSLLRRVEDL